MGWTCDLPYGRTWQKNLVWLVFWRDLWRLWPAGRPPGGTAAVSFRVWRRGRRFTVLWAIFALGNSLKVQFSPQGLRTERRLLGFMFAWHQVPHSDLQGLQLVQATPRNRGSRHQCGTGFGWR